MSGVPQGILQTVGLEPQALLAAGWQQTPPAPGAGLSEYLCAVGYMFLVNSTWWHLHPRRAISLDITSEQASLCPPLLACLCRIIEEKPVV